MTPGFIRPKTFAHRLRRLSRSSQLRRHLRFHHHRHAHARRVSDVDAVESRLRHADDRERIVVDDDRLPDDARVGAETGSPVLVTEHGNRMPCAHAVIFRSNHAPNRRSHSEHREIGARHELATDAIGLPAVADIQRHRVAGEHPREERTSLPAGRRMAG